MRDFIMDLVAPLRPAFLMSDPSSVALAVGVALWTGYDINLFHLLLVRGIHSSKNCLTKEITPAFTDCRMPARGRGISGRYRHSPCA